MAVLVILTTQPGSGQVVDTTIVRMTSPGKNDIVCIRNPWFDVKVETWDKSDLKIEYQLSVEAGSKKEIRAFLNAFNNSLNKQTGEVKSGRLNANVQFREYSNTFNRIHLKFSDDESTYTLEKLEGNLIIYMPKTSPLDAKTSFRKLNIGNLDADATVVISSSILTMGNCKKLVLESSFSNNMETGKAESAEMKLNSSSLDMGGIAGDLSLEANFSNIAIGAIGNKAKVKLNSSSFKTGDLKSLELNGSFIRSFRANNIDNATISLNSSNFEARKILSLIVEKISFSTIKSEDLADLAIGSSSSSKFFIENSGSVKVQSCSFSNFEITHLSKLFTISANSGSINIENIARGFEKIDIKGNFLTANLHTAEGCEYFFTGDMTFGHCDFGDLNIRKDIKEMSHQVIEGWKGSKEVASPVISVKCQSCKVNLE